MKRFYSRAAIILSIAVVAFIVASCNSFKKTPVSVVPQPGSANFATTVFLGNSLTAGYQSGALYESAQEYSYPAEIAKEAGIANFEQPLISDPGIGGLLEITNLSGPVITALPSSGQPLNSTLSRPYNNLGVPGALVYDMIDTSSFTAKAGPPRDNPFFQIVLRNAALGNSPVAQALALHPTFISVWIGANDVLGYATSGGTIGTDPATHSLPTDIPTFTYLYTTMMNALLAGAPNAKFVIANIPDVEAIPFFNTIPPVVVNPATEAPVLVNGSPVPLLVMRHDASGNLYAGQANPLYDKILLPALSLELKGVGIPAALGGTGTPLPDSLVLDSLEVSKVETAITGYNSVIQSVATANPTRVALVDAYSVFNNFAANGYTDPATGVHLTDSYITGGFFGLDGIHPTDQGYGYVANMFIKAINTTFGANLREVNLAYLPGSIQLAKSSPSQSKWPVIPLSDWGRMLKIFQVSNMY